MAQPSAEQAYKTSALIAGALIAGQVVFAAIAWFAHSSGGPSSGNEQVINPLTYAWIGLCVIGVIGALVLQQRIGSLAGSPETLDRVRDGVLTPGHVQTQVVIMWALLEAGGLLGLVIYFLTGSQQVLIAALAYIMLCAVVFFPRRVWFDAFIV